MRVILDATVGTPFLIRPLQRDDPSERPDFVIHSYTKDLSGTGSTIAGVVIGRNDDMFIPKGESSMGVAWNETMFWNVYYVKGAFLNADAAFEVIQGMRTLGVRMLNKCINTEILARFFDLHPRIRVHCNTLPNNENSAAASETLIPRSPAPLFTIDIEGVPTEVFQRFFDSLEPMFAHMISLGQSNTIVSCPALTTHSELNETELLASGISPNTIRLAIGNEDPKDLIAQFVQSARLTIDPHLPGFSTQFPSASEIDKLVRECYIDGHRRAKSSPNHR